jgi:glutamine amidotransferase
MVNKKMIKVLDYGMGNIGSIINMLRYMGVEAMSINDPNQITDARGIILPGVGHFDRAMKNLATSGMKEALNQVVQKDNIPILGICLGMQLMCDSSEEGTVPGLGIINAQVKKFNFLNESKLKIPHMGWNTVELKNGGGILVQPINLSSRFYFVHSYYVECSDEANVIGMTPYGLEFVSAFQVNRITGVQFHPEKSHKYGIELFRNFVNSLE